MRTVLLEEYQPKTESLTRNEVAQLLSSGLVDLRPLPEEGEYELRAGSVVGSAVLPTLRLLVRPKVGLKNLLFMLGYGTGITRWAQERFPYERDLNLFEAVAWFFESELSHALAQGLARGYQARHETLTTLRGRIDVAAQVHVWQGRPFPLECSFEEYTEDTELNRILKAAVRRSLQMPGLDALLVRRLRHRLRAFEGVTSAEYVPNAVPEVTFTRLDRHWEASVTLARLILDQQSIRDETGKVASVSFTVDMNKLFERFIERVVLEEARRAGYHLIPQSRQLLAEGVVMKPDLLLRKDGCNLAVGDAKYKQLEDGKPPEADLYQMLAYCVSLGLPAGLLIYAGDRFFRSYVVERAGIRLEAAGIDMSGEPADVLERARDVARRLLEQIGQLRADQTAHKRRR